MENTERSSHFLIVDGAYDPLLGLKTCIEFGLIGRLDMGADVCMPRTVEEQFLRNNGDAFCGLSKLPGTVAIRLKENAKPVLHYKKRVSLHLVDEII